MLLSISEADQKAILSFLSDTPPLAYWEDCDTKDRKIHFKKHKAFYTCLRDYLEAYFSGKPPTSGKIKRSQYENYQVTNLQIVELWVNYFLKMYAVLFWGWEFLEGNIKEDTPGQALIHVINCYFHLTFSTLFPEQIGLNSYREFSPRKTYQLGNNIKKLPQLKYDLAEIQKLPQQRQDKSKLRKLEKTIEETEKQLEEERKITKKFLGFQERVLSICYKNRAKKCNLAQALKDLKVATPPINDEILKLWHPKQKAQGYSLVKGSKKRGSAKGGTYK